MKIAEINGKLDIVDFNELDAYKIALKIERDGITFYKNLIEKISNPSVKESLEFLLREENKHLAFFDDRLADVGQKTDDTFEEDDLLRYMDYGIFDPYKRMSQMKDLIVDVAKALDLGIIIEDRTVKFYEACKKHVSSTQTKKQLQHIIDEEKKHKAVLESMVKS